MLHLNVLNCTLEIKQLLFVLCWAGAYSSRVSTRVPSVSDTNAVYQSCLRAEQDTVTMSYRLKDVSFSNGNICCWRTSDAVFPLFVAVVFVKTLALLLGDDSNKILEMILSKGICFRCFLLCTHLPQSIVSVWEPQNTTKWSKLVMKRIGCLAELLIGWSIRVSSGVYSLSIHYSFIIYLFIKYPQKMGQWAVPITIIGKCHSQCVLGRFQGGSASLDSRF